MSERVKAYAEAMRTGRWVFEGAKCDRTGEMFDGRIAVASPLRSGQRRFEQFMRLSAPRRAAISDMHRAYARKSRRRKSRRR